MNNFTWTDELAGEFVIFQRRNQHLDLPDAVAEFKKSKSGDASFEQITRPVIQWLNQNKNPHAMVLITNTSVKLLQDMEGFITDEFIKA